MKNKLLLITLLLMLVTVLCCCECKHEICSEATCTEPSVCQKCNATMAEAIGHKFGEATCVDAKTCTVCGETEGEANGHTWVEATCTTAKTCSVCSITEGEANGHAWIEATCTTAKTCSVCSLTEGMELGHSYVETISKGATCVQDGEKLFSCNQCDYKYSEKYSKPSFSANEIYEMTKKSVGEIITCDKQGKELAIGTGFVHSQDGKIITNYHVIENAFSAKITIDGTEYAVAQVLAYNKQLDLAVLKINADNFTPLELCLNEHAVGSSVYAFGSSKGLTATFSQGIITYANRDVDGILCVQHDAAISGGNSGGPLINQYGEVIGINTWTLRDSQNLNFAIRPNELNNLVYGTPLTMAEFYEKECDAITKIKNMAMSKGTYNSSKKEYTLTLGYFYSSDYSTKYTRKLVYDVADDHIYLFFYIDNSSFVMIAINDDVDGKYFWGYADSYGYEMQGTVYANTYTSSTLLGVSSHNIKYSSLLTTTRKLASTMVDAMCSYLDKDFKSIGVSAEDLGFLHY